MANNPRVAAALKAVANAKAERVVAVHPTVAAERELRNKLESGNVKDIGKAKEAIAKKYGIWPNGDTN